jgi:hypothetical protein
MGAIHNFFHRFIPDAPLRAVSNVRDHMRMVNFIEDLQGVYCRVVKPLDRELMGCRIIVDGSSDIEPPEDIVPPWSPTLIVDDRTTELDADGKVQLYDSDAEASTTDPSAYEDAIFPYLDTFGGTLKWGLVDDLRGADGAPGAPGEDGISVHADLDFATTGDGDTTGDNPNHDTRYIVGDHKAAGQPNLVGVRTAGAVKASSYHIEAGNAGADAMDGFYSVMEKGIFTNAAEWSVIPIQIVNPSTGANQIVRVLGKVLYTL